MKNPNPVGDNDLPPAYESIMNPSQCVVPNNISINNSNQTYPQTQQYPNNQQYVPIQQFIPDSQVIPNQSFMPNQQFNPNSFIISPQQYYSNPPMNQNQPFIHPQSMHPNQSILPSQPYQNLNIERNISIENQSFRHYSDIQEKRNPPPTPIYNPNSYGIPQVVPQPQPYNPLMNPHNNYTQLESKVFSPTVRPVEDFNPEEDAKYLKNELANHKTESIVAFLITRSRVQRQEILIKLSLIYKINFIPQFIKFRSKIQLEALFKDQFMGDCHYLYCFLKGKNKDKTIVNDIICTKSSEYLSQLIAVYQREYKEDLLVSLKHKVESSLFNLLKILLTTQREVSYYPNPEESRDILIVLGDHPTLDSLISFLTLKNFKKIAEMIGIYKTMKGVSFYKSLIEPIKTKPVKEALTIIYDYAIDSTTCYFNMMAEAIQGSNLERIFRVAVNRSEIDLLDIVYRYERRSNREMNKIIQDKFFTECISVKKLLLGVLGCVFNKP